MSLRNIIKEFIQGKFKPLYWLEGEETFFMDELTEFAEKNILSPSEKEFNLTIFYGGDTVLADLLNSCRRYPIGAARQVVILKEAQNFKEIEGLEKYILSPVPSTILIICYKGKKLDGKRKFTKIIKDNSSFHQSNKVSDQNLPDWIRTYLGENKFAISPKAIALIVEHIGNDLSKLKNELDKIIINLKQNEQINENHIEQFVGINKDYNIFEFQKAFVKKDLQKIFMIINYFEANPKAGSIHSILPTLFNYFVKVYSIFPYLKFNEKEIATQLGINHFFVSDYIGTSKIFPQNDVEFVLLLIQEYNLKSIGINSNSSGGDQELLKEFITKSLFN